MKAIRVLSIILVLVSMCALFFSCDSGNTDPSADIELPGRDFYDIKVSFQIKDREGKTIVDAKDYNYKSHAKPTILNIVDTYLAVVQNWMCKINTSNNTLIQIGANSQWRAEQKNGEYWGFVLPFKDVNGEMKGTNLTMEQIQRNLNDGKMSETIIENGGEFTVILIAE